MNILTLCLVLLLGSLALPLQAAMPDDRFVTIEIVDEVLPGKVADWPGSEPISAPTQPWQLQACYLWDTTCVPRVYPPSG